MAVLEESGAAPDTAVVVTGDHGWQVLPILLMYLATLRGYGFTIGCHRGTIYHSSVVEKLVTVGLYHRSRTLPGMTRVGGAPACVLPRTGPFKHP